MTEDVHPPILALNELAVPEMRLDPVTLAGPTCDSADVIARDYTTVTASRFNGIAATPIVMS